MSDKLFDSVSFSGKDFTSLMESVLEKGADFRFKASGFSMSPFIKDSDILLISSSGEKPLKTGDVVAFRNKYSGSSVIHRIVFKKEGRFLIKGDNLPGFDGVFNNSDILGRVIKVERHGKEVWFGGWFIALLSRFRILNLMLYIFRKIKIRR